jgi:UDP-N-acetylmuramoylalanine-D-glutamate ligase
MDRYATLKAYAASKARIFSHSETAVVNADEPEVVRMPRAGSACSLQPATHADFAW